MTSGKAYLAKMLACAEAHEYLGESSLGAAWRACDRPDWLLMVLERDLGRDDEELIARCAAVKLACVELARSRGAGEDVLVASLRPGEHLTPLMRRHPELRAECREVLRARVSDDEALSRLAAAGVEV